MFFHKPTPVPPPSTARFEQGIAHPALWLWDSWTTELDGTIHLYCLALSRTDAAGEATTPANRNDYPFHIRHFTSSDGGESWKDEGAFLEPLDFGDGAFARNIWSGCILARTDGDWLCGFTGIPKSEKGKPFVQTICIGQSKSGYALDDLPASALSCPVRDYEAIRAAGYYLPDKEELGAQDGEEGGPILAWRDPFIFESPGGKLEMFWSAKIAPARPAVAHATIRQGESGLEIETLHPPITLPDDAAFTQAEVPKVCHDPDTGVWYLLISACDRVSEFQPADEVSKVLRLYKASAMRGPWAPVFPGNNSIVPGTENLFGASVLRTEFSSGRLHIIAPYTEYAPVADQLAFAGMVTIDLPRDGTAGASARQNEKSTQASG